MPAIIASPPAPDLWSGDPAQLLGAVLSMPWVSLILAAIIAVGIVASPRRRARQESGARLPATATGGIVARYAPEHRMLGISAIAVIAVFLAENLITGYALNLNGVVSWWRYAAPVFTASIGIGVLLVLIATRGSSRPERPALSSRRTWLTFSPRIGSLGAVTALLSLIATSVAAGMASSRIGDGPYVYLEIGVSNESIDPIRPWFYGWAYGIPVLICTAVLVAVTAAALHANAARAFLHPEIVIAEQRERRDIAKGVTRIVTSGALLALAGAWRFIAEAGTLTGLTIQSDGGSESYEVFWRYGEIAAIGGWLAPALEITAFVLLLLVTAQLGYGPLSDAPVESTADAEAAR
ncbi:hypothetical protein [Microbacterium sp. MYb62]|uniref:hypothetical protein n=1 Tax=Microbacterium sp. MYb62 TaxID=1848690 RepID=UPI000CFB5589|nr:hypothetical protein [Microbacterium sp. MYb62]PRB12092.1 hypothetical protein CQ042_15985 [Microbacterium sp. MYb62]